MAEENILKVLSESLKIQLMSCMYKPRDLTSEKQLLPKFLSFYKVTLSPVSWLHQNYFQCMKCKRYVNIHMSFGLCLYRRS